jgi:hypothetical protein
VHAPSARTYAANVDGSACTTHGVSMHEV